MPRTLTRERSPARRAQRLDGRRERQHDRAEKRSADTVAAPAVIDAVTAPAAPAPATGEAAAKPAFRRLVVFGSLNAAA
jgi:hypothetical protein